MRQRRSVVNNNDMYAVRYRHITRIGILIVTEFAKIHRVSKNAPPYDNFVKS